MERFLFILLAAAVIGAAIYFSRLRRKKLSAWAASLGLAFVAGHDRSFDDRFSFRCLRQGHSRSAYNVMSGRVSDRDILAFDYRYVTGHGKNRSTHTFSAVIIESEVPLKPLKIRAENVFDRVAEFFGADDIDFESAEFSRAFHVKGPDRKWAFDVLHQRTIEFLLSKPRFSLEMSDREMIVWRGGTFSPERFDEALEVGGGVLDRLPRYIVKDSTKEIDG